MSANYFSLDIGGMNAKWALVSPDMVILEQGSIPNTFTAADELCEALSGLVVPYAGQVAAVGVSVPGTVFEDDPQGMVYGGGRLRWLDGVALGAELSFATSLPVTVENNGKACALGEYAAGVLKGTALGVVLVIGAGVGGGIISHGHLMRGAHNFAGEFSFLRTTPFEGRLRLEDAMAGTCGWEALKRDILNAKGMLDIGDVDGFDLFDWVNRGDPDALRGLHEYSKQLCLWILNLQCILDPEIIAIGGGISAQPALLEAVVTTMRSMVADLPHKEIPRPKIVACEHAGVGSLIGVAYEAQRRATNMQV
ncbi:MAG: ROK family protein [Coriobacteriales bacterium]|nr:ROK family protein [Coriobacteriales bacterium]